MCAYSTRKEQYDYTFEAYIAADTIHYSYPKDSTVRSIDLNLQIKSKINTNVQWDIVKLALLCHVSQHQIYYTKKEGIYIHYLIFSGVTYSSLPGRIFMIGVKTSTNNEQTVTCSD